MLQMVKAGFDMQSLKRIVVLMLLSIPATHAASAQEVFRVGHASKKYDLLIRFAECSAPEQEGDSETCSGAARVSLYRKGVKSPFQTLSLPSVEIYRVAPADNPEPGAKPRGGDAEVNGVVFDDFNFDGAEDLAVCNGRGGGYGGPSYDVFIFDRRSQRFVENRRLSRLTEGYLGLFDPDPKRKLLVAYSKSGCCYHQTEKYKMVNNRPVLVEKITEQASGREGGGFDVVTTTRRLVNGRWVKTVSKKVDKEN